MAAKKETKTAKTETPVKVPKMPEPQEHTYMHTCIDGQTPTILASVGFTDGKPICMRSEKSLAKGAPVRVGDHNVVVKANHGHPEGGFLVEFGE